MVILSYSALCDQSLITLLSKSDEQAYTEIYNRFFNRLAKCCERILRDPDESKDIVQDLFSTLWHKRSELNINGSLDAYLRVAIKNRSCDLISRKQIESHYVEKTVQKEFYGNCETDHLLRSRELKFLINGTITTFPSKMRRVFEMSRNLNFTHREIAGKLNISEQTVRSHIRNSLRRIRKAVLTDSTSIYSGPECKT